MHSQRVEVCQQTKILFPGICKHDSIIQPIYSDKATDPTVKIVKTFSYNGGNGEVFTYTTNTKPNYTLVYDHNGNVEQISATNDSSITPDILIATLEAMK